MQYVIESLAGQVIVTLPGTNEGFYIVAGGVTCDSKKNICFGNYVIDPTEKEIQLVEAASPCNGFTEEMKNKVVTSLKDRFRGSLNKLGK